MLNDRCDQLATISSHSTFLFGNTLHKIIKKSSSLFRAFKGYSSGTIKFPHTVINIYKLASGVDCAGENNREDPYTLYLFSFMRYHEFSVLILHYLMSFTEYTRNDHLVFQHNDVLPWIRLHSECFLVFREFVEKPVLFWTSVFQRSL